MIYYIKHTQYTQYTLHILVMSFIDLRDYTNNDVNIVEVFFCQKADNTLPFQSINTNTAPDAVRTIEARFKNAKETTFKSYFMRDKIYTYEIGNDNQVVTSKYNTHNKHISRNRPYNLFILSSKIEKYPPYIFPCTNEIDHVCTYTIKEFKINNRVSLIIKTEDDIQSIYIEYKHSPNVDIDKMNEIVNRLVRNL